MRKSKTLTSRWPWDFWSKNVFLILTCNEEKTRKKVSFLFQLFWMDPFQCAKAQNTYFRLSWRFLIKGRISYIVLQWHNLKQSAYVFFQKKNWIPPPPLVFLFCFDATTCIAQEIQCLAYAWFLSDVLVFFSSCHAPQK